MSHNDPQEAFPQRFTIKTPYGERWFRFGSRATNPLDQWPDPDVYIHAASGQKLSGNETRNLNRAYPGRADGTYTEKVAYAITELIKKNDINMEIDLHEASPEYPVINAIVAHERAMPISSQVVMNMEFEDIQIGLEPSPPSLHGLSHRELGDYTNTYAVLMETANASQGRLRGKTDENLVLTGKDPIYVKAQKIGRLFVPYDENGHPIEERGMMSIAMNIKYPDFFAASYLVACQWNPTLLTRNMKNVKWWITVSQDDAKAYPGEIAITEKLASFGAKIARADHWNAQWSPAEFQAAFEQIAVQNANVNFIAFAKGTVFKTAAESNAGGASGHTSTWKYAYNIVPILDWIFQQSKVAP